MLGGSGSAQPRAAALRRSLLEGVRRRRSLLPGLRRLASTLAVTGTPW